MAKIGLRQAQRLATLLSGEIRGKAGAAAGEPETQRFSEMSELACALHRETGMVRLGVVSGALCVGRHRFRSLPPPLVEFCRLLELKGVAGIILKPEVSARDLMILARQLSDPASGAAELSRGLRGAGVTSIEIREDEPLTRCYNEAIGAVREIFRQIEQGGIPEVARLLAVAGRLAGAAADDPARLLGLTLSKDYDKYSFHHSVNVGVLAMALAAALGLSVEEVEEAGITGFLHDVGKSRIDRSIVTKPGKLTRKEYAEMKRHPELGAEIIRGIKGLDGRVADGVLGHHIRYDREGYPEWAKERQFGVVSSIVAVADCYDATTTLRAYQPRMHPLEAVEELRNQSGSGLDAGIVKRFLQLVGRYPVGSLVRLSTGEIAVVLTPSSGELGAATVQVVTDALGALLPLPVRLDLAESGACIVGLLDPIHQGIDVSCCF